MAGEYGRPAVVLLAEDDPGDQELTRRAMQKNTFGVDLHIVPDGEAAMNYLNRRGQYADPTESPRPDLLLLDLNMPRLDGKQVLQQMQTDQYLRSIPVVVLTTSNHEDDVRKTYDLGCKSYITKPLNAAGFFHCIRELGVYWFGRVTLPSY
ncbi:MAG: response regulator [Phycisphaerales bacterium]|nr:response regulator [Phycisphaerales bacterium]